MKSTMVAILSCVSLIIIVIWSLLYGTVFTPINALFETQHPLNDVIWRVRWPRILNGILVGACLSLSGLMIQNMVKNPLADPYLLGVSGGAASVQLFFILTASSLSSNLQVLVGFAGGLGAALLLLKLSYYGQIRTNKLTLNGVVLAFGFAALISLMLTLAPPGQMKSMMFWLMGDLSFVQSKSWHFIVLCLVAWVLFRFRDSLDILARGELFAVKSGVNATRLNLLVFCVAALLTSVAVTQSGTIGFVGLVVPHMIRLLVGNRHVVLIPLSLIAGSLFLVTADTLSRIIMSPIQLPVGIFTALIGVPVFLWLNSKTP